MSFRFLLSLLNVASWWLGLVLSGGLLALLGSCQSPGSAGRSAADYLTTIPDPKTLGETYVSDPDSLLAPGTAPALNARLDSLDRSGRAHLDVVLVRSIGEAVPKTAATALFNKWKIGRKDTDNGLLMLLVLDQRRVEFETGYGLEADLPDVTCYRIQQRFMVPALREDHYDQAVQQGVAALIRQLHPVVPIAKRHFASPADSLKAYLDSLDNVLQNGPLALEDTPVADTQPEPLAADSGDGRAIGILVIALGMLLLYPVLWYRTAQALPVRGWLVLVPLGLVAGLLVAALGHGWPGTVGGFLALSYGLALGYLHGYFGWQYWRTRRAVPPAQRPAEYERRQLAHRGLGFTAYLFPVLLAGYWPWYRRQLAQLRQAPFACPTCGESMQQVAEETAKSYLEPGQQTEESIRSVAYEVWACAQGHHLPLGYPNLDSEATPCPACHYRTFAKRRMQPVQVATTTAEGWGWRITKCHFCQHEEKERETIPRRSPPASRSGSSSSSSSSSWGSSSSSSSSGSSSSSTSSGGSSGGGGAGSSW